jgi:hypothetical protein
MLIDGKVEDFIFEILGFPASLRVSQVIIITDSVNSNYSVVSSQHPITSDKNFYLSHNLLDNLKIFTFLEHTETMKAKHVKLCLSILVIGFFFHQ